MGKAEILSQAEDNKKLSVFKDIKPIAMLESADLEQTLLAIKSEALAEIHDVGTEDGRQNIKSLGAKIGKSSKFVENAALEHARKLKEAPKIFDGKRKIFKDFMENLKDEVIQPLEKWEAEKQKHALWIGGKVTALMIANVNGELIAGVDTLEGVESWVKTATETVIDESFEGSQEGAERFRKQSLLTADGLIARYQKEADEAAKEEKQRLEQVAKDKAGYEAKVKKDAEEAANKAAEKAIKEAEDKATQDKIDAENAEKQRAAQSIIDRDNAVKAEAARVQKIADDNAAEERAKVKAELDRKAAIAVKERAVKEAAEKKSSTQKHRQKVYDEMLSTFDKLGIDQDKGKATIKVIAEGNFPYIKLDYVNK